MKSPNRCPFCGSVNVKTTIKSKYPFATASSYVRCMNCNARGPLFTDKVRGMDATRFESNAISLWNGESIGESSLGELFEGEGGEK